jgi:putative ABC transport system substrate-binding protein
MFFQSIFKKTIVLTSLFSFFISITATCLPLKVGIIQVIEHSALDETRRGIQDELNRQFQNDLQLSWESAQGNPALATQIAQKYNGQNVNIIIAIGTTAAQAALNSVQNSNKPVVFASVTDPENAKLVGNITGVSNFVTPQKQFDVIQKIMGTKKRIGIIYNPGEANSSALLAKMQATAQPMNFQIVAASASRTSEVISAAESLAGKVDAIFINNDNTALASINSVGKICSGNEIPLFSSDGDPEASQALAIMGANQYEIGRQAGRMAAQILQGKSKAVEMKAAFPDKLIVKINRPLARTMGINIPDDLADDAGDTK